MNKLEALNSLEVTDLSSSCGELEYVIAADTDENQQILRDAGFTQDQINHANDDGTADIDLCILAGYLFNGFTWCKSCGFRPEAGGIIFGEEGENNP